MRADLFNTLQYDPVSGEFRWLNPPAKARRYIGERAGTLTARGYVRIKVDGRLYAAHRLAWLFSYGFWPENQIDHINGVRHDNRIENLRDVSARVNSQNRRRANANNSSGLLGVSKSRNRFQALIRDESGHMTYLGKFDSAEAAHDAYLSAKDRLHQGNTLFTNVSRKRAGARTKNCVEVVHE